MRDRKKDKKAQKASDKALMASVSEEMAQPRMTKSSSIETEKLNHARDAKAE
jgi:hypothetical protein